MKNQQKMKKIKIEKKNYERQLKLDQFENNDLIIDSLFEKEAKIKGLLSNPLDGHQITKEYRTKMVDWMVEVCTSFRCYDRTWFLAVQIFDKYLSLIRGQKILKNSDVHPIGVVSIYLASKYEDVVPINSFIAHDKISHKAVSQKDILAMEADFLRAFDF